MLLLHLRGKPHPKAHLQQPSSGRATSPSATKIQHISTVNTSCIFSLCACVALIKSQSRSFAPYFPFHPCSEAASAYPPSPNKPVEWALQHAVICQGSLPLNLNRPGPDFLSAVLSLCSDVCWLTPSKVLWFSCPLTLYCFSFKRLMLSGPPNTQQHAFSCFLSSPQLVCLSACQALNCHATHGFGWGACRFAFFHLHHNWCNFSYVLSFLHGALFKSWGEDFTRCPTTSIYSSVYASFIL